MPVYCVLKVSFLYHICSSVMKSRWKMVKEPVNKWFFNFFNGQFSFLNFVSVFIWYRNPLSPGLLPKCLHHARYKSRAGNSIQVSHMGDRTQVLLLPRVYSNNQTQSGAENLNQALLVWNVDVPSDILMLGETSSRNYYRCKLLPWVFINWWTLWQMISHGTITT